MDFEVVMRLEIFSDILENGLSNVKELVFHHGKDHIHFAIYL